MKKNISLALLFLGSLTYYYGQFEEDYTPIKSNGKIPRDFVSLATTTYLNVEKDNSNSGFEKKAKDKFYLESSFSIARILHSGRVLFGDPITNYCNAVFAKISPNISSELSSKIRIYTLKSSESNAFATSDNIIFVTTGLISQLENEAQLAYILSHEISHLIEKHGVNQYVEIEKIDKKKGDYKGISFNNAIKLATSYSKEHETEADSLGLDIYLKSGYTPNQVLSVFDVLAYSYLPFDEDPLDIKYITTENFIVPNNFILKEVKKIEYDENYNDEYSSHPNILKRRKNIEKLISMKDYDSNQTSFISHNDFLTVRELARFETVRINLIDRNYQRAIYHSQLLLKKYPYNKFLKSVLAKAYYGYYIYDAALKNSLKSLENLEKTYSKYPYSYRKSDFDDARENLYSIIGKYEKIQGNEQSVYFLLHSLSNEQVNILALSHFWNLYKNNKENPELEKFTKWVLYDLISLHGYSLSKFSNKTLIEKIEKIETVDTTKISLSKYDKIKGEGSSDSYSELNFHLHTFASEINNEDLIKLFSDTEALFQKNKAKKEAREKLKKSKLKQLESWEDKYSDYLGLDSILTINPFYKRVKKKGKSDYIGSEKSKLDYINSISENSSKLGLYNETITPFSFNEFDIDKYNNYSLLNEWLYERFSHGDLDILPLSTDFISEIYNSNKVNHLYYSGINYYRLKKKGIGYAILGGILFPYTFPLSLYYFTIPNDNYYSYHYVFDLRNGRAVLVDKNYVPSKDKRIFIDNEMYRTLYKIKNAPKKPKP